MTTIFSSGNIEIVAQRAHVAPGFPPSIEFYVYDGEKLVRVCPSIGMAREVAASI